MRKIIFAVLLAANGFCVVAQNAALDAELLDPERKKPVNFTHQPFLLLKVTPTALLAIDNVLQFGVEIAPPFGKFSFNFDYGIGKGKNSLNKVVRERLPDTETKLIRGEVRMYFSDWYPFYALDKKPFGRYYAVEFMNKDVNRTQPVNVSNEATETFMVANVPVAVKEQAINFKIGKHFLINRFFFLDAFVGLGPGLYSVTNKDTAITDDSLLSNAFELKRKNWQVGSKGIFFSRTAGLRLCLAI